MIRTKRISIFVLSFIVFGFLLFALPEKGISFVNEGCCVNETTGNCVGCDGCATSTGFCEQEGGTPTLGGVCAPQLDGPATCLERVEEPGCCVSDAEACIEDLDAFECFGTEGGIIWNPGSACTEIPACTRNVPAVSQWGFIALAGVLGLIALVMVIRRRKAIA